MLTINTTRMSAVSPSATLAMTAKAKALQKHGVSVMNLSAGEPDMPTPACIVEAAARALHDRSSHAYTGARGTDALVAAMQTKLQREQRVSYATSEVIATVGTKGALMLALDALIGAGDEVVIFSPYWVTYPDLVRLAGGVPVIVPTDLADGYRPDLDAFSRAITPRTKLVVLCSPNNPTGAGWPEATLRAIMQRLAGSDIWVISDEIYERLVYGDFKHVSPASFSDDAKSRTLVVGGVAKAYAMTGWRVGLAAGPSLLVDAMLTLQQQRVTCPSAIAQVAAAYALNEDADVKAAVEAMRSTYEKRRAMVLALVAQIPGVRVHPPEGAFYMFLDVSSRMRGSYRGTALTSDTVFATALLQEAHVAFVPGTAFGGAGCLRMSYAASDDDLNEGLSRLATALASITTR